MKFRAASVMVLALALLAVAPAPGMASHSKGPFVRYARGKHRLEIFTKYQCFKTMPCKHRVRHCRRWARNQVSCQSEILFWEKKGYVTYCHWEAMATRKHHRTRHLEVWSEPKPMCKTLRNGARWPVRGAA
jgi:hypothetical protein